MENALFSNKLKEFLVKMGYEEATIEERDMTGEKIYEVSVSDAKYLIGEKGTNLTALEFLVKMICQKQDIPTVKTFVDINGYRKEKAKLLKEAARLAAQKAVLSGKPVLLPPMSGFDRKVIHVELAINPSVATESAGYSPERYVVIKPYLN